MTDSIGEDGEMISKSLAKSIASEIGLELNDETLDPLIDACHKFLEAGVSESELHATLSDLLSELQRAGSLNNSFEEVDSDEEEDAEPEFDSKNLFNRRDDDDY